MEQQECRWIWGANAAVLFTGLCTSSASIILPLLRGRYGLSYDLAGLLLALLSVGNMSAGVLAGLLPDVLGMRASVLLLCAGGVLGYGILAVTGQPAALMLAFILIGVVKGGTVNNSTVLTSRRPGGISLMQAFYAIGSLLAPIFVGLFTGGGAEPKRGGLPWYAPMLALAVCGALNWLSFACVSLPRGRLNEKAAGGGRGFLRSRFFWMITILLFFQNSCELTVAGWVVTYFQDTGILTGTLGNYTVTVIWGSMLVVRLLLGSVLRIRDHFKALAVMSVGSIAAYLLLLSAKTGPAALVSLALFGLAMAGTNPMVISSTGSMLSNASMGVMLPVGSLGAIFMPSLVGAVAERTGIWGGMLCVLGALLGMLALSLLCRRQLQKEQAAGRLAG